MTRRRFCIGRESLGICAEVAAALSKDGDVGSASFDSLNCHEPRRIAEGSSSDSSADECAGLKVVSIPNDCVAGVGVNGQAAIEVGYGCSNRSRVLLKQLYFVLTKNVERVGTRADYYDSRLNMHV